MRNEAPGFEPYQAELLAWFRRRVRNPHEAEDLCQDTYARVLARDPELRDPTKARPYLFRAARNVLINRFRRHHIVGAVDAAGEALDPDSLADAGASDPERNARASELRENVERLLETLPTEQRTAFELGVFQRLLYSEIAESTGWSLAKVKVNVYRARQKLIAGLREYRHELSADPPARIERERP